MKKLITMILILALALPALAMAETLSENEKNFVGAWSLYAKNDSGKIYAFYIVFTEDMNVVQQSMTFEDGSMTSDNEASGNWSGFTNKTIIFTLAGTGMTAMIKDDGFLYLYFYEGLELCGIYSRCQDMTESLGW